MGTATTYGNLDMNQYFVLYQGQEIEVCITPVELNRYACRVQGKQFVIEVAPGTHAHELIFKDDSLNQHTLFVQKQTQEQTLLRFDGVDKQLQVLDPRAVYQYHHKSKQQISGFNVVSPMPGKVTAVLVKEGQTVEAGQGLIVVEAMKMENEFKAPAEGVIERIFARVGDAVESSFVLIHAGPVS